MAWGTQNISNSIVFVWDFSKAAFSLVQQLSPELFVDIQIFNSASILCAPPQILESWNN